MNIKLSMCVYVCVYLVWCRELYREREEEKEKKGVEKERKK